MIAGICSLSTMWMAARSRSAATSQDSIASGRLVSASPGTPPSALISFTARMAASWRGALVARWLPVMPSSEAIHSALSFCQSPVTDVQSSESSSSQRGSGDCTHTAGTEPSAEARAMH